MGKVVVMEDGNKCALYMENAAGALSYNADSFNEALWRHGGPALQTAVDIEAKNLRAYVEKKLDEQNAAFNAKR